MYESNSDVMWRWVTLCINLRIIFCLSDRGSRQACDLYGRRYMNYFAFFLGFCEGISYDILYWVYKY